MPRLLLPALLLAGLTACATAPVQYQLVWEDTFEGPAGTPPSSANWGYDIGTDWGNQQLEFTTDRTTNAALDGAGRLVITARREDFNGRAYTSARITTAGKREFTYGRFEARMRLPSGQGLWPAFWMLGADLPRVGWPNSGEIDIMEFRGQEPTVNHGSIHGPGYSGGRAITRRFTLPSGTFDGEFHVFRADWERRQIRFYVDDVLYHRIDADDVPGTWVFNKPFYLILNVAVGGTFVGPVGAGTTFPQQLVIDWVRVSQERN
jgi:beta-glucanase (GH16 family)